ncbi:MAG: hypothetical protein KDK78_08900 [Chlamydiia bacterium]|nr:hypothetical protein [Chlamydiia bacterium]
MAKKSTAQSSKSQTARSKGVHSAKPTPETDDLPERRIQPPSKISPTNNKTCITVHYNCGQHNSLFIRGIGGGLNWKQGTALKNIGASEWAWETEQHFGVIEFKVLVNDAMFEDGSNRVLICGTSVHCHPTFENELR